MNDETHRTVLAATRLELHGKHRKEQARLEHAIKVRNKRIRELEAQVTRLQQALVQVDGEWAKSEGYSPMGEEHYIDHCGLQPGDLDPIEGGDE